jgi:hypothetical protein
MMMRMNKKIPHLHLKVTIPLPKLYVNHYSHWLCDLFLGLSCLVFIYVQVPCESTCALKLNAQVRSTFVITHKEGITTIVSSLENKSNLIGLQEGPIPTKQQ